MVVVVIVENFVQKNDSPRWRVSAIKNFPPLYRSIASSLNQKETCSVEKKCSSQNNSKENLMINDVKGNIFKKKDFKFIWCHYCWRGRAERLNL